ncbi:MAG: PAS domain-containing protein, partial [Nitrospirota bacterium]
MPVISTDSKSNRLLRDPFSLINSLEDAVLLLDRKYVVVFINRKGEEFFGKGHREIVGRKLREIFPDTGSILKLAGKAIKELRSFSAKDVEAKINGVSKVDFQISPFFLEDRCEGIML